VITRYGLPGPVIPLIGPLLSPLPNFPVYWDREAMPKLDTVGDPAISGLSSIYRTHPFQLFFMGNLLAVEATSVSSFDLRRFCRAMESTAPARQLQLYGGSRILGGICYRLLPSVDG
jgi:hypothetical protein